jgi:hypothetical protein
VNKFFDIKDIAMQDPQQPSAVDCGILVEEFFQVHEEKIRSVKKLIGRFPSPDEIYFLWTVKSFNAFTFISYIVREFGVIDELILSTYSINIRIIDALIRLVDQGKIHHADIFISDSIRSKSPKVYDHLRALVEKYPVAVTYAWNHSKIGLARTGENHFVIEGSGNWGENAQFEQYVFLNSRKTFEFRKNAILTGIKSGPI